VVNNQNEYKPVDTTDKTTRKDGEEVDNQNEYNPVDPTDRTTRGGRQPERVQVSRYYR